LGTPQLRPVWVKAHTGFVLSHFPALSESGQCHVPLLDLFGLATVEAAPPGQKGVWRPGPVRLTPFGMALGGVLATFVEEGLQSEGTEPVGSSRWCSRKSARRIPSSRGRR